jgi:hypothetical protein
MRNAFVVSLSPPVVLLTGLLLATAGPAFLSPARAQGTPPGPCVVIGMPNPKASFQYHYSDSTGSAVDYTNR